MNRIIALKQLKEFWIKNKIPNITERNSRFLRSLIKIQNTKNMLEIGSANWFSSVNFWLELEKIGWKLTTIELSDNSYKQTLENISLFSLQNTITAIKADAIYEIPRLKEVFDFVFIDAMKRKTLDFLKLAYNKTEIWWIIVIDDVIKFKDKMVDLWDFLEKNKLDYNLIPIDIDDGILFMVKQKDKLDYWEDA